MALSMKKMIGKVQEALYTRVDYSPGRHTWSCFYLAMCKNIKFPYTIRAFSNYLHITDPKLVVPFDPNSSLKSLKNCISGSFSWKGNPISIMIANGKVIRHYACHSHLNKPESVLWYSNDGKYGITQAKDVSELPGNLQWAIGGAGMKQGNDVTEGFTGAFSDVFRRTSHMLIGFDQYGYFNAVEVSYMNKTQMISHMKKLGIETYILLDGGSITASNIDGHTRNLNTVQSYAISLEG
jgi:hypothetical protein